MFFGAWSDANDCITCAEALQEQKPGCVSVTHRQNVLYTCERKAVKPKCNKWVPLNLLPQAIVNFLHSIFLKTGRPREIRIPANFFCTPELD